MNTRSEAVYCFTSTAGRAVIVLMLSLIFSTNVFAQKSANLFSNEQIAYRLTTSQETVIEKMRKHPLNAGMRVVQIVGLKDMLFNRLVDFNLFSDANFAIERQRH